MTRTFQKWAYGFAAGVIGGTATSLTAMFGFGVVQAVGIPVQPLNLRQLGMVAVTGIISNGILFLMKSPLPPMESDTDFFAKWSANRLAIVPADAPKTDKPQ